TAAGTYTPYLIIKTATGCIDTSFVDTVTVVNPPNVSILFSPSVACWNTPIQTTLSASPQPTPGVQHWHVDSDNGFFSGCINNPNPQWNFSHTGVHTFTVSGYLNSCQGSNTSTASVTIKGPIAQGRFETNCTTRKVVNFYSQLQDAQAGTLNFGDNSSVSIVGSPGSLVSHNVAHTYSATGNYTAVLTATNAANLCSPYTYTMLVKVRDAVADFTVPAVACASVTQIFDGSPSIDEDLGCERGYVWYIDNQPPMDTVMPLYSYTFMTPGTHTVMLMVKDENSCGDTTMKTLRISQVSPQFSISANPICLSSGTVNLFNFTSQTPDPVTNYSWNFGDGTNSTSSASPLTHTYTSAASPSQTFTITLTAMNSQGCIDSKTQTIVVSNPVAFISPSPFAPCLGTPVNFSAPAGAGNTYTYNFGASASSTLATSNNTTSYLYSSAGPYTASIILKDANGCISSNTVALTVYSMTPADFTFSSPNATGTNNICSGSPVAYTCTTQSSFPLDYTWSMATINSSVVTGFIPASTSGSIVVTVTVSTNPLGCTSVQSKTINVYKATANLNLDKTTICLGNSINFNVKDSSTVFAWTWFFGDGDTLKAFTGNPPPTINHVYSNYPQLGNGSTTVTLVYYSPQYACKYFVQQPITIVKLNPIFNRNNEVAKIDSVHCLNIPDLFSNITPGSSGYNFNWSFGDGGTSTQQNPSYTYPTAGIYQVTLTVTDPVNNCLGYSVKNMTINALPAITIVGPDSVCKGSNIILNSSGSPGIVSYTWSPASAVTTSNTASTASTATLIPATYSLGVTDANGCSNKTVKNIYVQSPPLNSNWDTTVIVGQYIPINGYAGPNYSYTWTPTIDLSCISCMYPTSSSTVDITYSLTVQDGLGCFKTTNTYSIHIDPRTTVDVPTAFTPNGDGTNDIIYADGWGIKRLNYFRIYNRWGQLLFESNDIKVGWDGNYNGVPQNMETYIYQVSVDTYLDKEALLKTGSFKLIR
ncbi:MAG: PKD domain-containing protein, partial [Bacteroidia bacterium]